MSISRHATARGVGVCIFLTLAAVVFYPGCSTGPGPVNRIPTVTLTSGPVEGDTVSYSINLSWSGTDTDGFVARFEYAVDPPSAFTEEEISDGGPGIVVEEIPGSGDTPAVTRVTKTVDGGAVSFDWVHTDAFSHHFAFSTPDAEGDSTRTGFVPSGRFLGMHAVYVRAVDDHGAVSVPDKVAFTALNVAPESQITRPLLRGGDVLTAGLKVTFEWTGTDPDSPHPGKEPDHYLFKGVNLDTLGYYCPIILCPPADVLGSFDTWEALSPGTVSRTLELDPGQYVFGLAAVDENGGVEPFLDLGRNVAKIQAFASGGYPIITLDCTAGTFTGSGSRSFQAQIPTNTDLAGEISCDAGLYGEACADLRWGLDLVDLEGTEGWSPWTTDSVLPPILFDQPGVHILYVQARDTQGTVSTLALTLDVVEFPFDRDVLLVDDSFDTQYPTDAEHDAFWHQLLQNHGVDPIYEFSCFGDNDRGNLSPAVPTLEELGRYRLLVWVTYGAGYNGESALLKAGTLSPLLRSYLRAGGQLWVTGRMTVPPMLPSPNGIRADLTYPIDEDRLMPGTFAWDFMKLQTYKIMVPQDGTDPRDLLVGVAPFPGGPAPYDSMTIDPGKLRIPYQVAVSGGEGVFDPIFSEADPAFRGDIDSLFAYRAYGPEQQSRSSIFQGRLNAIRWHDPDPAPLHGRVQWFGFDLYFIRDTDAQETFNRSLDWFREGAPPANRGRQRGLR